MTELKIYLASIVFIATIGFFCYKATNKQKDVKQARMELIDTQKKYIKSCAEATDRSHIDVYDTTDDYKLYKIRATEDSVKVWLRTHKEVLGHTLKVQF